MQQATLKPAPALPVVKVRMYHQDGQWQHICRHCAQRACKGPLRRQQEGQRDGVDQQ